MEYRYLGKSGVQVSALSFGSWLTFGKQIGDKVAENCMKLAYSNGINFFDNAEAYASGVSEIIMGKILRKMGWSRSTYLVSSKVFWGGTFPNQKGLSRKHVVEACHAALRRLQVEYLDFYFCHRPDINTPIEETVWAMNNLIQQGKVLYWGTSEWSPQEIQEAITVARQHHLVPPTMEQPQYNMFTREVFEVGYYRLFRDYGLGSTIWSPLASGLLTGKYNHGIPRNTRLTMKGMGWLKEKTLSEERIERVRELSELAGELGTNTARLSIAWCLKNPNVSTVILGSSKTEQLSDNLKSLEVVPLLTQEIMQKIEVILGNKKNIPFY